MRLVSGAGGPFIEITDSTRTIGAGAGMTQVDTHTVRVPIASVTSITLTGSAQADYFFFDFNNGDFCPSGGISVAGGGPTVSPGDTLGVDGDFSSGGTYGATGPGAGTLVLDSSNTIAFTGLEPVDLSAASFTDFTITVDPSSTVTGNVTTTVTAVDANVNTLVSFSGGLESVKLGTVTGTLTINGDNVDNDYFALRGVGTAMAGNFTVDGKGGDADVIDIYAGTIALAAGKNLSLKADFIGLGMDTAGTNVGTINVSGNITLEADGDSSITTPPIWGASGVWGTSVPAYLSSSALFTQRGSIQMRGLISKTAGADATATLKARAGVGFMNVAATGGAITSSSNKLHVVVNVDSDANNDGSVQMQSVTAITTNGGNVTIGGGADPATGPSVGVAGGGATAGVLMNNAAITTAGGNVSIRGKGFAGNSGFGVLIQASAATNGNPVISTGSGSITLAGTGGGTTGFVTNCPGIQLQGVASPTRTVQLLSTTGAITLTGTATIGNNNGIALLNTVDISATGASEIAFTGTSFGVGVGLAASPSASQQVRVKSVGGNVTLVGDSMALDGGAGTRSYETSGAGILTVKQLTNGRPISFSASDSGADLGITPGELASLTASTVQIGDSNSGAITVSTVISPSTFTTLALASGSGTTFGSGSGFSADVTSASNYEKITVAGTVSITAGATFSAASAGGYVWNGTDTFTFLANDSTDAISGTFTGPTLTNFLGSALTAQSSYAGGTGNDFVVGLGVPSITSVSPATGGVAGGSTITITGSGFTGATAVTIGGVAATSFTVVNDTTITAVVPSGSAGATNIVVTGPAGTGTGSGLFTYAVPPTVANVNPSSGTTAGGTSVTITGTGFTGATSVTFGGTAATSYTVNSATQITATTPAHGAGAVSVDVTALGGTNAANTLYIYTTPGTLVWQVQSDFFGTQDAVSQARSLRGLALSGDGLHLYTGFVNGTTSAAIRETSSGVNSSMIGNEPTPFGSNPPYTTGLEARVTTSNSPRGIATDDRGNVYATLTATFNATSQNWAIYASNLNASAIATRTSTSATASTLGGLAVARIGASYYAYVGWRSGLIERWDVTTAATPVLDTTWGAVATPGKISLKTIGANAYLNGLAIDSDGTIFVAGGLQGTTSFGDALIKIPAAAAAAGNVTSLTTSSVNVQGGANGTGGFAAMDVALYKGKAYVTEYLQTNSTIAVFSTSDLSSYGIITPPNLTGPAGQTATYNNGTDSGFSGIDIGSDGKIYVAEQFYKFYASTSNPANAFTPPGGTPILSTRVILDRVLVSTALPTPPALTNVSPAQGATAGGTSVTITGTDFTGATSVTFGGAAASSFTVDSATQITATTPAHAAGAVSVDVTSPAGTSSANTLFTYVAPPTVAADNAAVTVDEGSTAANTGTFSGMSGDTITISASTGTVTQGAGTWSWSAAATDGPAGPDTVTITATDSTNNTTATTTFTVAVNNVAPTIALSGNSSVVVNTNYRLDLGAITDPGTDTVTAYSIDWGDDSFSPFTGNPTGVAASHAFSSTGEYTITVTLTDEDGTYAEAGTITITVTAPQPYTVDLDGPRTDGQTTPVADFGSTIVGGSLMETLIVFNPAGNSPLQINSVTVPAGYRLGSASTSGGSGSGSSSGGSQSNGLPRALFPGATLFLDIYFEPTAPGTFPGNLVIHTDAADDLADFSFAITGTAVPLIAPSDDYFFASTKATTCDVLANDHTSLSGNLVITGVTQPASNGSTRILNGRIIYTPLVRVTTPVTFNYTVTNGSQSLTPKVTIYPSPTAGVYVGLLTDSTGAVKGRINVTVNAAGSCTGLLRTDGAQRLITGSVLNSGLIVYGYRTPGLLTLVPPAGYDTVAPTLAASIGAPVLSGLLTGTLERSPYDSAHPAPQAGRYTMVANLPAGGTGPKTGAVLTSIVTASGTVTVAGHLGEGTAITQGGALLSGGRLPFYFGSTKAGVVSRLSGQPVFDRTASPQVSGTIHWLVPGGFSPRLASVNQDYSVLGAFYTPAASGATMLSLTTGQATLSLEMPTIGLTPKTFTYLLDGPIRRGNVQWIVQGGTTGRLGGYYLSLGTGIYYGYYLGPQNKHRDFFGVVLQGADLNYGQGYTLDLNSVGASSLTPVTPRQ
jgi:hypothetical protein